MPKLVKTPKEITHEEISGLENVEKGLRDFIRQPSRPISYLYGSPGTGKTSVVEIAAREENYCVIRVDEDLRNVLIPNQNDPHAKGFGILVDWADLVHAVLLFNEAQRIVGPKSDELAHDYFMELLDTVLKSAARIVMTSNRLSIDAPFSRRILPVYVDVPSSKDRSSLIKKAILGKDPSYPLNEGLVETLSGCTQFFTWEDIKLFVNENWDIIRADGEDLASTLCKATQIFRISFAKWATEVREELESDKGLAAQYPEVVKRLNEWEHFLQSKK